MSAILITGANGEIGQALIRHIHDGAPEKPIITLDLKPPVEAIAPLVTIALTGDVTDPEVCEDAAHAQRVDTIFHLAALLSTRCEQDPELCHHVNVDGTLNMLRLARTLGSAYERVTFVFPSSIAVYGLAAGHNTSVPVREDEYLAPTTMYGINKLYCEHLGRYYARFYHQEANSSVDFRALRFPGIISAQTLPTGGTTDYASEMIHAAVQGKPYAAFVSEETTLPFMMMPDAVRALLKLAQAPADHLTRAAYNVNGFSISAAQIAALVARHFPASQVSFAPNPVRQRIVDSWPNELDDNRARADWDWSPAFDVETAFSDYLIPGISAHYGVSR